LYEGQHLSPKLGIRKVTDERRQQFTSGAFLFKKTALILAKCEAMVICIFISSGLRSSTVSQKGARIWSDELTQVSTMDHISLQSTSVAT
jgi:soluble P-type ATPase